MAICCKQGQHCTEHCSYRLIFVVNGYCKLSFLINGILFNFVRVILGFYMKLVFDFSKIDISYYLKFMPY